MNHFSPLWKTNQIFNHYFRLQNRLWIVKLALMWNGLICGGELVGWNCSRNTTHHWVGIRSAVLKLIHPLAVNDSGFVFAYVTIWDRFVMGGKCFSGLELAGVTRISGEKFATLFDLIQQLPLPLMYQKSIKQTVWGWFRYEKPVARYIYE